MLCAFPGHEGIDGALHPPACAGYVVYSVLKERTWFKEVSKKAIKQSGSNKDKAVEKNVVDRSDYLVGTPHDLLQKKKTTKKAK